MLTPYLSNFQKKKKIYIRQAEPARRRPQKFHTMAMKIQNACQPVPKRRYPFKNKQMCWDTPRDTPNSGGAPCPKTSAYALSFQGGGGRFAGGAGWSLASSGMGQLSFSRQRVMLGRLLYRIEPLLRLPKPSLFRASPRLPLGVGSGLTGALTVFCHSL